MTCSPSSSVKTNDVMFFALIHPSRSPVPTNESIIPLDGDSVLNEYSDPNASSAIYTLTDWKLFPNPFSETAVLVFENETPRDLEIQIYNVVGQWIDTLKRENENQFSISGEWLESGIYFFTIVEEGEIIGVGKFVVE